MATARLSPRTVTASLVGAALVIVAIAVSQVVFTHGVDGAVVAVLVQLGALTALGCALVVARRRPGHPVSALLSGCAAAFALVFGQPDVAAPSPFLGDWVLFFVAFAFLLLLYPDGHLPTPRWRLVAWALPVVAAAIFLLFVLLWATATAEPSLLAEAPLLLAWIGLLGASAASLVVRYRHADPLTRLRLRWIMLAGVTVPFTLLLCWISYLLLQGPDLVGVGALITVLAVPAAAAVGVVAPQRFDVERLAAGTATGTVLGLLVLAVLTGASAAAGLAVARWSTTTAVVASVVVTLAVTPLYRVLRRYVDRALYPDRERSRRALENLTTRVREGSAHPEQVERVLREALRDPGLRVGYRAFATEGFVDAGGAPLVPGPRATEVRLGGDVVGILDASDRRATRPPDAAAALAAPLVEEARLRSGLALALAEVAASRERLLHASYAERRRLERDLHDGAQQRLVALGMSLRVLQRARPGDETVGAALDTAVAELATAVAELRQLAHGVRPSALDDGLGAALGELVRPLPLTVDLQVADLGTLPEAVSATAYYVASEAVTNALRHAEPQRLTLRVERLPDAVRVEVRDDGCGGASVRPGGGLAGLHDRVAALGGVLSVLSGDDAGTLVEAVLPCAS